MTTENTPKCPVCGEPMTQTRKGATLKKRGPCYVCPVAMSEVYRDSDGRLHRFGWAKHTETRLWDSWELKATP